MQNITKQASQLVRGKLSYVAPTLLRHGSVSMLTCSGSSGGNEVMNTSTCPNPTKKMLGADGNCSAT